MATDESTRVNSSTARAYASVSLPPPPYSSGNGMPMSPSSPSRRTISYGKRFSLSSSSATGATSPSAKSRTVRWMSRCSSVRSRSIVRHHARSMRIGVLTGGGDCPGLNAVIRAIVRTSALHYEDQILGFRDGWKGPIEGDMTPLTMESTRGILPRGGTILRSSRTNPFKRDDGVERVKQTFARHRLDGLIAIGGEDTLGVAHRLIDEQGLPIIGVPKTIDNDLGGTEMTFGFDTAVQVATDAIDRLHTTAESHNRVLVLEVMGRHAGWIALWSGLAGGADVILIPERPVELQQVFDAIRVRHDRGSFFSIVVVAEGAKIAEGDLATVGAKTDEFGHERLGGIGERLAQEIERNTGYETRSTSLGHIQRGGTPTAFDRVLATRFGVAAIQAAHAHEWGMMAALRGGHVDLVPLADAV